MADGEKRGNGKGEIKVGTNNSKARFTITGPATYTESGTTFSKPDAPAGEYTITYEDVPGVGKPLSETQTLPAGGSISFEGKYTEQPSAETPGEKPEKVIDTTVSASSSGITVHTATGETSPQQPGNEQTTTQRSLGASVIGLGTHHKNVRRVATLLLVTLTSGLVFTFCGALLNGTWFNAVSALLWSAACSAVGWILGFLFGIPRTLQTGEIGVKTRERETPPAKTDSSVTVQRTTDVNTNLEQISDWLTKILVGVTLVQLDKVTIYLKSAATLISESLGGSNIIMMSFAYALMIYFSIIGFLGSYLLTRLFLQRALEEDIEERGR